MLAGVVVVDAARRSQADVFYLAVYLRHEPGRVRGHRRARARDAGSATTSRRCTGSARDRPVLAWPMTIAMLALAGFPATGGLLRQDLPDRGGRRQRLRLARRRDRARLGDLARLLPARRRGGLDAPAVRRPRRRRSRPAPARRSRAARPRPTTRRRPRRPAASGAAVAESEAARRPAHAPPAPARGRRSSPCCARWPRSRSGSTPSRCSTSPATRARRSTRCSDRSGRTSAPPAYRGCDTSAIAPHRRPGSTRVRRPRIALVALVFALAAPAVGAAAVARGGRRARVQHAAVHRRRRHLPPASDAAAAGLRAVPAALEQTGAAAGRGHGVSASQVGGN